MIRDARFHGWSYAEGLVNPGEIAIHEKWSATAVLRLTAQALSTGKSGPELEILIPYFLRLLGTADLEGGFTLLASTERFPSDSNF